MLLDLSVLWCICFGWLLVRAISQRRCFTRLRCRPLAADAPSVAIIVPARNEGADIGPCLDSLAAQAYPPDRLRIVVVDDDSSDDTRTEVAKRSAAATRLKLIRVKSLPRGWTGKSHACWVGSREVEAEPEWFCFIDADMRAGPGLLAAAVAEADASKADLLSLAPRFLLLSFAERMMIPTGCYVLAFTQDLVSVQKPGSGVAAANGQFMLVRGAAYREVGGHAAVGGAICEDLELALLLKRRGRVVCMQDGSAQLETRMYTGWAELWPGFAKNLTEMLGGPATTLTIATAAVILAWAAVLLPLVDAFACLSANGGCIAASLATAGLIAALAFHVAGSLHFDIPFWYGLLFPISYSIGWLMAADAIRRRLARNVVWKGRRYT